MRCLATIAGLLVGAALQAVGVLPVFQVTPIVRQAEGLLAYIPHPFNNEAPEHEPIEVPEEIDDVPLALWPCAFGMIFLVLFGPKHTHARFRKVKGASFVYGDVALDRNTACRGHFATGKTGSGKTQVILFHLLHSRFINEAGRIRPEWTGSQTAVAIEQARKRFRDYSDQQLARVKEMEDDLVKLDAKIRIAKDSTQSSAIREYVEMLDAAAKLKFEGNRIFKARTEDGTIAKTVGFSDADIETRVRAVQSGAMSVVPKLRSLGSEAIKLSQLQEQYAELKTQVDQVHYNVHMRRLEFQKFTDAAKPLKYEAYPWGGLEFDEKALLWQTLVPMAAYHQREDDLMLLQTRPDWGGDFWRPPARFNLLSDDAIDPDTYAKMLVDTALAVEGSDSKDPFFPTQAQIQIGWGIKLMRAARDAQAQSPDTSIVGRTYPSLSKLLEILTIRKDFDRYLIEIGAIGRKTRKEQKDEHGNITESEEIDSPRIHSAALSKAIHSLQDDYWSQPEEQRGGVTSTVYNYLIFFAQPDVAEVFCSTSTFSLKQIGEGKIVCIAMPQKLAAHRRYIATILKNLGYSFIERRFDIGNFESSEWINKNYIVLDQDEAQSFVIKRDGALDKIREAHGTAVLLSQTHMAVYQALGGKEKGAVTASNLANRYIARAALEECAEESAKMVGKEKVKRKSHTYSRNGNSTSESEEERYIISPLRITNLPDFHVFFVPADGAWLYKLFLMQPVTPDGKIPKWWFGTYDPLRCVKALCGKSKDIPFWAGRAPFKVHIRHLLGFDTTFIQLEARRRKK